jgi:hypothetical protein
MLILCVPKVQKERALWLNKMSTYDVESYDRKRDLGSEPLSRIIMRHRFDEVVLPTLQNLGM